MLVNITPSLRHLNICSAFLSILATVFNLSFSNSLSWAVTQPVDTLKQKVRNKMLDVDDVHPLSQRTWICKRQTIYSNAFLSVFSFFEECKIFSWKRIQIPQKLDVIKWVNYIFILIKYSYNKKIMTLTSSIYPINGFRGAHAPKSILYPPVFMLCSVENTWNLNITINDEKACSFL